jgi:DNA-directed RNA polymerase subunit RPC12/RpoP
MERSLTLSRAEDEEHRFAENESKFRCDECKEKFHKPLLATVSSQSGVQKYYACPRCLTKVSVTREQKNEKLNEKLTMIVRDSKPERENEKKITCDHSVGYLRIRPKNTPIPEECLTCDKMVDCMLH